jgi:hypothetical protein
VGIPSSGSAVNETLTSVTQSGKSLSVAGYNSVLCTITAVFNATSSTVITSGNYTQTNCNLASSGTNFFNNTNWAVSYSYTYKDGSGMTAITQNVSNGMINFFTNAGTYFALLGVVVIILIISLVVVVVNRFGGESQQATDTM